MFQDSAREVRVEEPKFLVAELRQTDGNWRLAKVDLDEHLGNENGHFQWGGRNFSRTARNVHFGFEGAANVPVLRAELRTPDGAWEPRDVNLNERVFNNNGHFEFQY
ncbi:Cyanovirin-N [Aspergillus parasiticus]|uniref:Cyanovirin-N n=1 Tax=Aspergillus parasiticus TaxID=5067 RepID=A0A5N6E4H8_ASPPA|nr:Cyanovirin-N [Aspergillus parasiticus]